MKKIKIVRIITRLNNGGPAKHVVWLNAGLNKDVFDTVLVAGRVEENENNLDGYAAFHGIRTYYIPEMTRSISFVKDAVSFFKLVKLFIEEKPDIIHTHTSKAGFIGRVGALAYNLIYNAKVVHTYHGHTFHGYFGPLKGRVFLALERFLAGRATDRIVVISKRQFQEIHKVFLVGKAGQFDVIPLGVDTALEDTDGADGREKIPFRREFFALAGYFSVIGIVGRIAPVKNHLMFLTAASIMLKRGYGDRVRFVIIGDGAGRDTSQLREFVRKEGMEGFVVFAGNRHDTRNFFDALDIVALTSVNEGTPLSLIEAMAAKKPFVATDVGGVGDLMVSAPETGKTADGLGGFRIYSNGILVNSGDADGFAAALQMLVENKALGNEMGNKGREFVNINYSKERLIRDIENLYMRLIPDQQTKRQTGGFFKNEALAKVKKT
jgi:glycosyltransferase involved in cell wall biosynthesis